MIWVGTYDGITRFRQGRWIEDRDLSAQVRGTVSVIMRDRAGALWFGGTRGVFRLYDGRLTHYARGSGLPGGNITVIHEDRKERDGLAVRVVVPRRGSRLCTAREGEGFVSSVCLALRGRAGCCGSARSTGG